MAHIVENPPTFPPFDHVFVHIIDQKMLDTLKLASRDG